MINILLWMLVLGPHLLTITDGCGRVPATPAPTTVPPTPTEQTINGSVRALKCTPEEVGKTKCLNNGTCFVLKVAEDRIASCQCPAQYMGRRCEELNIEVIFPILEPNHIATAGIAASIAVLVIIIIVFTTVAIVYYRRKRRRRADQERVKKTNGGCGANNILLPENNVKLQLVTCL